MHNPFIFHACKFPAGTGYTLFITEPEQTLEATLINLLPFTVYSVTLSASTSVGTGSGPAVNLTTGEAGKYQLRERLGVRDIATMYYFLFCST